MLGSHWLVHKTHFLTDIFRVYKSKIGCFMIPTDRYCHSGPGNGDNSILTKLSVMPFCHGAAACMLTLKGELHPWSKISMYLKIVTLMYASYSNSSKKLKNIITILVDPDVFMLWFRIVKILFWSITQVPLDLLKFQCYSFLGQFTIRCIHYFSKRCWPF